MKVELKYCREGKEEHRLEKHLQIWIDGEKHSPTDETMKKLTGVTYVPENNVFFGSRFVVVYGCFKDECNFANISSDQWIQSPEHCLNELKKRIQSIKVWVDFLPKKIETSIEFDL